MGMPWPNFMQYGNETVHEMTINILEKLGINLRLRPLPDPTGTSLMGKTAIVTGGNRGIGRDIVEGLSARGCRVIMAVRNIELGKKAAEEIISRHPNGQIHVMKCDMASFKSVRAFAQEVNATESRIDFLVNNAGITTYPKITINPEEVDGLREMDTMMTVMLYSVVLLTILLYNKIKSTPEAKILFVASLFHNFVSSVSVEDMDWPGGRAWYFSVYGHVKLSLVSFTSKFAKRAFKDGIRVYGIDPGLSKTDIGRQAKPIDNFLIFGPLSYVYMRLFDKGNSILVSILVDDKDTYDPQVFYFKDGKPRPLNHFLKNEKGVDQVWQYIKKIINTDFDM